MTSPAESIQTKKRPRSVLLQLGVIVEQRPGVTHWQEVVTLPHSVFLTHSNMDASPRVIYRNGPLLRYIAGIQTLTLHRKETDDYIANLRSNPPRIYIGLRQGKTSSEFAWTPFLATAAPYEAEGYMHGGDEIVEGVAIPEILVEAIAQFVDAHHQDQPFKKRQRNKYFNSDSTPFARPPGWRETDR